MSVSTDTKLQKCSQHKEPLPIQESFFNGRVFTVASDITSKVWKTTKVAFIAFLAISASSFHQRRYREEPMGGASLMISGLGVISLQGAFVSALTVDPNELRIDMDKIPKVDEEFEEAKKANPTKEERLKMFAKEILWWACPWKKFETISTKAAEMEKSLLETEAWMEKHFPGYAEAEWYIHGSIPGNPYQERTLKDILSVLSSADKIVDAVSDYISEFADSQKAEIELQKFVDGLSEMGQDINAFYDKLNADLEENIEKRKADGTLFATSGKDVIIAELAKKAAKRQEEKALKNGLSALTDKGQKVIANWNALGDVQAVKKINEIGAAISKLVNSGKATNENGELGQNLNSYISLMNQAMKLLSTVIKQEDCDYKSTGKVSTEREGATIDLLTNFQSSLKEIENKVSVNPKLMANIENHLNKVKEQFTFLDDHNKMADYENKMAEILEKLKVDTTAANDPLVKALIIKNGQASIREHYQANEQFLQKASERYNKPSFSDQINYVNNKWNNERIKAENIWFKSTNELLLAGSDAAQNSYINQVRYANHLSRVGPMMDEIYEKNHPGEKDFFAKQLEAVNEDLAFNIRAIDMSEDEFAKATGGNFVWHEGIEVLEHFTKNIGDQNYLAKGLRAMGVMSEKIADLKSSSGGLFGSKHDAQIEGIAARHLRFMNIDVPVPDDYQQVWSVYVGTMTGQLGFSRSDLPEKFTDNKLRYSDTGERVIGEQVRVESRFASRNEMINLQRRGHFNKFKKK